MLGRVGHEPALRSHMFGDICPKGNKRSFMKASHQNQGTVGTGVIIHPPRLGIISKASSYCSLVNALQLREPSMVTVPLSRSSRSAFFTRNAQRVYEPTEMVYNICLCVPLSERGHNFHHIHKEVNNLPPATPHPNSK